MGVMVLVSVNNHPQVWFHSEFSLSEIYHYSHQWNDVEHKYDFYWYDYGTVAILYVKNSVFGNIVFWNEIHLYLGTVIFPICCKDWNILGKLGQYHGCWCPGSLNCLTTSKHCIDYVGLLGPCFSWRENFKYLAISVLKNDWKRKYVSLFAKINPAWGPSDALWHQISCPTLV